jgi:hypothetical protein
MRNGWLILALLIATGTNTIFFPSACGSHDALASRPVHPSSPLVSAAPVNDMHFATAACPTDAAATHFLGFSTCSLCSAQASPLLSFFAPLRQTINSPVIYSADVAEIYLSLPAKPPTLTHS